MHDELDQLLKSLHLAKIRRIIEQELKDAEKKQVTYTEFLLRLLRAEWHHKQESALNWRIKRAALPEKWTLESFPFKHQPGVSRRQIRGFASLDFAIPSRKRNEGGDVRKESLGDFLPGDKGGSA